MMEIKYPGKEQKEQSIAHIMQATRTQRVGTVRFLVNAYREIGVTTIFRNSYQIFLLSAGIFVMLIAFSLFTFSGEPSDLWDKKEIVASLSLFFFSSPFVLLSTDFLYQLQERPFDVYEMQNTCKYTARHLILLRMPLFSLGTMLIDIGAAVAWCARNNTQYLPQIIGLITSGVMLYSLLNIAMFNRFDLYGCMGCAVIWFGLAALFCMLPSELQYALVTGIPAAVHILSGAAMCAVLNFFVKQSYRRVRS